MVLAVNAGCPQYCKRQIPELSWALYEEALTTILHQFDTLKSYLDQEFLFIDTNNLDYNRPSRLLNIKPRTLFRVVNLIKESKVNQTKVEKQIKHIIKKHYGWHLWSYKPELEYEDSIEQFVSSLVELINCTKTEEDSKKV